MSHPIISVENLSKLYRIGLRDEMPDTLVGALKGMASKPLRNFKRLRNVGKIDADQQGDDILWAIRDVSFTVDEGEVVGIIGRNGAGKSTLLKILSRITFPTSGRAVLNGRVSSLLEVGTGFHPELTGRENIYMNGTILGMRKKEIDSKFDEIVDFSGVEKFLDTPTKRYSSGMKVRLAFAVAAHLEPEILIIDEVLAVGDQEFQKKCLGKMQDVAAGGRTVLFVSHNMAAVARLCSSGIVIASGKASEKMDTEAALETYLGETESNSFVDLTLVDREKHHSSPPVLESISISDSHGDQASIKTCAPLTFAITIADTSLLTPLQCGLVITDNQENRVLIFHSWYHASMQFSPGPRRTLLCEIPSLPLIAGRYNVDIALADSAAVIERVQNAISFEVEFDDVFDTGHLPTRGQGHFVLPCHWGERKSVL